MNNSLVRLITGKNDIGWSERWRYNCAVFIISYIFMGAVTGILNDVFITYLQLVVPDVVKALPAYGAIAGFVIAGILLFVPKIGYRKIIIPAPIILIIALLMSIYSKNGAVILVAYILSIIGAAMYDSIYPLMMTSYVPRERRTKMFSKVLYCNLISQCLCMFFDGKILVWKFSEKLHISYDKASALTENPSKLNHSDYLSYLSSYSFVLWIAIILTIISFLILFSLKEQIADYQETNEEIAERKSEKKIDLKVFKNKYVIMWVIAISITSFGASLIIPYLPIYLNSFLHIGRGVVSTILTLQYLAMVLAYFATPWVEKKIGAINCVAGSIFFAIPLMLLIANGSIFGTNAAMIIGGLLFLRSGLANVAQPIRTSLPLTFVPKNAVPAYNSLIMIVGSIVGIGCGLFTRYYLFTSNKGYETAYYIASGLYLIASIIYMVVFYKKYNRQYNEKSKEKLKSEQKDPVLNQ